MATAPTSLNLTMPPGGRLRNLQPPVRTRPVGDDRRLAARAYWGIENIVHWVRDVTFAEDRSTVHTGTAPQVMASLRNTVLNMHRLTGADNIAEACRVTAFRQTAASTCSQTTESAGHKRASQQRRTCPTKEVRIKPGTVHPNKPARMLRYDWPLAQKTVSFGQCRFSLEWRPTTKQRWRIGYPPRQSMLTVSRADPLSRRRQLAPR